MGTQFKAGEDIHRTMKDLIAKFHPRLATVADDIAIVFKEKATLVGDAVISGKTAKAPPIVNLLQVERDWKFVLTLAEDEWASMTDKQRAALIDHHLCACGAEEQEKGGEMKYFVRIPDVSFFREEVERHGYWRTSGAAPEANHIQELFGDE